jgi:ribonuclease BN (tRNA processing enzyme)
MNIHVLGAHNYESRVTRCACLLIDDTLVIDAGGLTAGLSLPDQKKLKAILLTHQHYDHIRDIPGIALNLSLRGASIEVYSTPSVRAAIETHLLNGEVYPKFQELPEGKPTIKFNSITPYQPETIEGHGILAIPVNHCDTSVGYQVSDAEGKVIFHTGDTGPGLLHCWKHLSPQLIIVDVTVPNSHEEFAVDTGHLTPRLLNEELIKFGELKGYLPRIIVVHMDPALEREIEDELAVISEALKASITVAHEGMEIHV